MRKKIFNLILAFLLILPCSLFMVACGGESGNKEPKETGFIVKLNNVELSSTNNALTITYEESFSNDWWTTMVSVEALYDDNTTSYITADNYIISGIPTTLDANTSGYDISVSYKEYDSISFKLIVNRKTIDIPVAFELTYNGDTQSALPAEDLDHKYTVSNQPGSDSCFQTNANSYSTKIVTTNNYIFTDNQTEAIINWQIKPMPVIKPTSLGSQSFTGEAEPPQIDADYPYEVSAEQDENFEFVEVGSYYVKVNLKNTNYIWEDLDTNPIYVNYEITSGISNSITEVKQLAPVNYGTSLNGTADNKNPLGIVFTSQFGESSPVSVRIELSSATVAYYDRNAEGIWTAYDSTHTSVLETPLNASPSYLGYLTIPGNGVSYDSITSSFFIIVISSLNIYSLTTVPSSIESQYYTGSVLTANVPTSEYYNIVGDTATNVGTYDVTLVPCQNYTFGEEYTITLSFNILKSTTTIENLSVTNWEYGETTNSPTSTLKLNSSNSSLNIITYYYARKTSAEQTATDASLVYYNYSTNIGGLNQIGEYFVKAVVVDCDNYSGCTEYTTFEISKINLSNKGSRLEVILDADCYWTGISAPFCLTYHDNQNVLLDSSPLTYETDFTVSLTGTTLKITGAGDYYTGEYTKTLKIISSLSETEAGEVIEFPTCTITNKLTVNKNLTFLIPFGETITGDLADDFIEVTAGTLTLSGYGSIIGNITADNKAIIYINGETASLQFGTDSSLRLKSQRAEGDTTSKISNFKVDNGSLVISKYAEIQSDWCNVLANGGTTTINEHASFTTDTVGFYITNSTAVVNINKGSYRFSSDTQNNNVDRVGIEILAGTLNIGTEATFYYASYYSVSASNNITANEPGKLRGGVIVAGKPDGTDYAGDITINIELGAAFYTSSDQFFVLVWDKTYRTDEYTFLITGPYADTTYYYEDPEGSGQYHYPYSGTTKIKIGSTLIDGGDILNNTSTEPEE